MNRRDAAFALIALGASPVACFAQQVGRTFRIGFIAISDSFTSGSPNAFAWLALESRLRELGYREGENLGIERRHASGDPSRLKDAASELVKLKPEVIVAFGAQAVTAASQASSTVPIVSYTGDPVALGFAASYSKPGGNVTGVSPSTSAATLKEFEILVELVPRLRRVAWLRNPTNPIFSTTFGEAVEKAGVTLGVRAIPFDAGSADALEAAVTEIARLGFEAVLVRKHVNYET